MSCSAMHCTARKSRMPEISLHRFPKIQPLRRQWIEAVKRESLDNKNELWEPSKHSRLCSLHFRPEDTDLDSPYKRKLKSDAVPSIFAWSDGDHNHVVKKKPRTNCRSSPAPSTETSPIKVLKEETGEFYIPQNERTDLKIVKIEELDMPQNEQIDFKILKIEELNVPKNGIRDLENVETEELDIPQNERIDLEDVKIEVLYNIPQNERTDLKRVKIEELCMPQNEQSDLEDAKSELLYNMPLNERINLKKELEVKLKMKNENLKMKEQALQLMVLKDEEIERLKKLVNKNSEVILRKRQKLKRLNSSKSYFDRKLSTVNKLIEELNSLEQPNLFLEEEVIGLEE